MEKLSRKKNFTAEGVFAVESPLKRQVVRAIIFSCIAAALFAFTHRIEALTYQNYLRDLKLDTTVRQIQIKENIENKILGLALDLNNLATLIGERPNLNANEFNLKAVDFVLANPDVIWVATAPNLVVDMVYPSHGNQDMRGMRYADDPARFVQIEESMLTGTGMIEGPVQNASGARALILRKPVSVVNALGVTQPWGMVSVALDYDSFMTRLGIPPLEAEYDIAIVTGDIQDPDNLLFMLGEPQVIRNDPVLLDLTFPFGQWTLAVTPDNGWPTTKPGFAGRWATRLLLIGFSIFGLWYILRLSDRGRAAERQLSIGIEALDHGFVMFDADRRLVAFNKKYKQLAGGSGMVRVGARYEDIVKANLELGLIPDAVGREEEWYENWSQRLETKASDNEQVLADGRLIRAYDRPMEDGSVVGLRIDITDLKKAQMAAEAANRAKTDFMGVLSHELRTPLTVILGHARLAKNLRSMPGYKKLLAELEEYPDAKEAVLPKMEGLHGQVAKMMEALERSGNHLFYLISEILDFAKIDSGTLVMDMEDTTTDAVLDPVVDQMRPLVEEKGLRFDIIRTTSTLNGDSKRLQQVLINLISNASKFTEKGGITVETMATKTEIIFRVMDTGIGIPAEHVSKVFEAFHQVDSTSGRKFGGTGLGLAISQDIARAHEGQLTVESEVGQGSTFTLTIPRERAAVEEDPEAAESDADANHQPESMVA